MSETIDLFHDKLWNTIFSKGTSALVEPRQIRRHGIDRRTVRAEELREIARVQKDLQGIIDGKLRIDDQGALQDAADDYFVESVRINSIIETDAGELDLVERLDAVRMLNRVERELTIQAVKNELTIRHIAILAEEECRYLPLDKVSSATVDMDWLARWKEGAQGAASVDLKRYWARLLAGEVIRPSTYSVRTMEFFRTICRMDLEMIRLCAKFCFDGFIYRSPGKYFSKDLHLPMFETLEELGILRGVYGRPETWLLSSATSSGKFKTMLACQHKAIFVEGDAAEDDIRFPVYKLTRFGREIFSLFRADADIAYLASVANELKKKGFDVQLGDWSKESGQGLFTERMAL